MKKSWRQVFFALAAVGVIYVLYRVFFGQKAKMSHVVKSRLPIAKDLPTVSDYEANYDLDGVSYDDEGTIVSSAR